MYINYGDVNFFENGVLIDTEHTYDPENGARVIQMLRCIPYTDQENVFEFGELTIDIDDSWIDRAAVMDFIGMSETDFDAIYFAIGCVDYYGMENFGAELYDADFRHVDREYIKDYLKHRLIANDNLNIEW